MTDTASRRDPVDLLAEEFSARLRAGETPSIDDYVRRCPEHAASIRAVFPSIALVERISDQEYSERRFERRTNRVTADQIKTLGDFRIIREIGRGGMGIVYEAVQSSLNRRVALKVLGPHVSGSATQLQRFRREAEAAARLHHTNIVPIYGIGEEAGSPFLRHAVYRGGLARRRDPFARPFVPTAHGKNARSIDGNDGPCHGIDTFWIVGLGRLPPGRRRPVAAPRPRISGSGRD